jgi:hypothetical protein
MEACAAPEVCLATLPDCGLKLISGCPPPAALARPDSETIVVAPTSISALPLAALTSPAAAIPVARLSDALLLARSPICEVPP